MVRYTIRHIARLSPFALGGCRGLILILVGVVVVVVGVVVVPALQAVPKRAGSTAVDVYVTTVVSLLYVSSCWYIYILHAGSIDRWTDFRYICFHRSTYVRT
jgi:hypothetical protein